MRRRNRIALAPPPVAYRVFGLRASTAFTIVRATTLGGDGIEPWSSSGHHFNVRVHAIPIGTVARVFRKAVTRNAVPLREDRSRLDNDDIDAEGMQFHAQRVD